MSKKFKNESNGFHPELKKGLIALSLITIGILIILSYLGLAGKFGEIADKYLALAFGLMRYVLPLILFYVAYTSDPINTNKDEEQYSQTYIIGAFLIAISGIALTHLIFARENSLIEAQSGNGGGYSGHFLTIYPIEYIGIWATAVIFAALLLASFIFIFKISLFSLLMPQKSNQNPIQKILAKFGFWKNEETAKNENNKDEEVEEIEYEEEKTPFIRRMLGLAKRNSKDDEDDDDEIEDEEDDDDEIEDEEDDVQEEIKKSEIEKALPRPIRPYKYPPMTLLKRSTTSARAGDIKNNQLIIQKTLGNFGIQVDMGDARVGPTVTQYTLRPADGVKLNKITGLSNDLALALAAHPIRIEAPIPGKSLVGIEVPNQKSALVTLADLLIHDEFKTIGNNYHIALGKDVSGKPIFTNLPKLPHLLVAGATGSGKTVCINTIILSLIFQHSPEELKFIMVDPKRVELPLYNGIPHLLTPVITDVHKTVNALKWTISEMERRFDLLSKAKKRDISSYNETMRKKNGEILPLIIFIVDELADLMVSAGAEVEGGIIRLVQMARAVGIHLILATQRPSVDVITGLLKANIPGRIAFSVASIVDSRTILDSAGADKLIGRGDMLYQDATLSKPKRIQGAFVSEEEMKRIIDFIKHDDVPLYNDAVVEHQKQTTIFGDSTNTSDDPLFYEARELVIQAGKASASYLQRRLKVGYARAARLLDMMEEAGIIGPSQGAKPRDILVAENQFKTPQKNNLINNRNNNKNEDKDEYDESIFENDDDETEEDIEEEDNNDEDNNDYDNDESEDNDDDVDEDENNDESEDSDEITDEDDELNNLK